jgi:tetratricopeptide (TPR) repeat protein
LRTFQYIGIGLAVAAVAYLSVYGYTRYINKKGQEAYNKAYDTLGMLMTADPNPVDIKRTGDLFKEVIDEYGSSKAARVALPQVAYVKFKEKKYDEAISLYEEFSEEMSGDRRYQSLTALALGSCYEAKGDLKKAIAVLVSAIENLDDPFRETAMLSLERMYRLDNQPEKANEILKEFVKGYPDSPFLAMAKSRL